MTGLDANGRPRPQFSVNQELVVPVVVRGRYWDQTRRSWMYQLDAWSGDSFILPEDALETP